MEKFSHWRDKPTGISPFMPLPREDPGGVLLMLRGVVFAVKMVFFTIALILCVVPFVGKSMMRLILLLTFNVSKIEILVDSVKRSNQKVIQLSQPSANDICVVNFTSPLDVLVLALISKGNCIFFIPDSAGLWHKFTIWGAMAQSLKPPIISGGSPLELDNCKGKTIFLFAEGTTSNNKSVLPFVTEKVKISSLCQNFKCKAISLRNAPNWAVTTPMPMSFSSFFWRAASSLHAVNYRLKIYPLAQDTHWEEVRAKVAGGKLQLVSKELSLRSKKDFIEAFHKYKSN